MANQAVAQIYITVLGDGVSTTATINLTSTAYQLIVGLQNFSPTPDTVFGAVVADENGQPVPASAVLSKNGKQVLIVFSSPITVGKRVTVTVNLGYYI
jgi:hypothetical protein